MQHLKDKIEKLKTLASQNGDIHPGILAEVVSALEIALSQRKWFSDLAEEQSGNNYQELVGDYDLEVLNALGGVDE